MKRVVIILFYLFLFEMIIEAQIAMPSSGGNASGSGGSMSYTVGQLVYTTNTGTNGTVAQGVQQPYEISVITGYEEALDISLEFMVYPNPARDFINLKIENYEVLNLRYRLYDINGNLLQDSKIEGSETSIVMSNLVSEIYFLKVSQKTIIILKPK